MECAQGETGTWEWDRCQLAACPAALIPWSLICLGNTHSGRVWWWCAQCYSHGWALQKRAPLARRGSGYWYCGWNIKGVNAAGILGSVICCIRQTDVAGKKQTSIWARQPIFMSYISVTWKHIPGLTGTAWDIGLSFLISYIFSDDFYDWQPFDGQEGKQSSFASLFLFFFLNHCHLRCLTH